jgi:hypothetical protein
VKRGRELSWTKKGVFSEKDGLPGGTVNSIFED